MIGMDPQKDLRDITAFGSDTDKCNGTMIVRAKANRELLEKMVAKAPDHETMEHRSHTLHAWTHKGWKGHKGEKVVGAFQQDDVMVFARTADQAEDVVEGLAAWRRRPRAPPASSPGTPRPMAWGPSWRRWPTAGSRGARSGCGPMAGRGTGGKVGLQERLWQVRLRGLREVPGRVAHEEGRLEAGRGAAA